MGVAISKTIQMIMQNARHSKVLVALSMVSRISTPTATGPTERAQMLSMQLILQGCIGPTRQGSLICVLINASSFRPTVPSTTYPLDVMVDSIMIGPLVSGIVSIESRTTLSTKMTA